MPAILNTRIMMVLMGLAVLSGYAQDQAGFRGDGGGLYPDAKPELSWSPSSNVVWKTALPKWSNASPLLLGDRLYVCAEPAMLVCVDAGSGTILWEKSVANLPKPAPPAHPQNGYTSPTPCTDGKRIWTVFGYGIVGCWDLSGTLLWSTKLEVPPNAWGSCSSPRLAGGCVIVQYNTLFGLNPTTGETVWKLATPWGWGSPVVARIGDTDLLYTCKGNALDAATGKAVSSGLVKLDYNSPILVDGILYFLQQHPQAYALPKMPTAPPTALWTNITIMGDRYYASPLVYQGLVYAINQSGTLSVLDQRTGALIYTHKVASLRGTVYTSPTLAGHAIFLFSEGGQNVVIQPGPEYKELARNTLEPLRSCPVFAGSRMYVRGLTHLWCIGN